jgi:hypothetical protein
MATVAVATVPAPDRAEALIFWNYAGRMGRAQMDGSKVQRPIVQGARDPHGIAASKRFLWWADTTGSIGRSKLNGSGVKKNFINANSPYGIAVDGAHVYWGEGDRIARANLDGTGVEHNFVTGISAFGGLAVDGTYVYWATGDGIGRAKLDGSDVQSDFIADAGSPFMLAVSGSHIYWSQLGRYLGRASLDGTNVEDKFVKSLGVSPGIAVLGKFLYWSNNTQGVISRSKLNGKKIKKRFVVSSPARTWVIAVNKRKKY